METVRGNETINRPVVATIGMFDGVHLGHRSVVSLVVGQAAERGWASAVITFARHPQTVLHPDSPVPLLMSVDRRISALAETGIDYTVLLDFDRRLASLTAAEFLQQIYNKYNVRRLIVGYDHRFGHNRSDSFDDYVAYGRRIGIDVVRAPEFVGAGAHISSSTIRRLISDGDVVSAEQLLGGRYSLSGTVVEGNRLGRTIGFPTANIQPLEPHQLIPAAGVYAVVVRLGDTAYRGMLNIGTRPTVDRSGRTTIEVHIFDFAADIYGTTLTVEFVQRVRAERRLPSVDSLRRQLVDDRIAIENILNSIL
ncbi:MAG: bifunctional riboflavin kinase/FAD synthetase [Candidatus Limisoma sp.]|nr:bifunctional riboflavin kinase/FAD synthetase [Bacteroidales bacterium]